MNLECAQLIERWPLILEFKLPEESNVIVIGAYKGLAMEALDELYHPAKIIGYEPQLWAVHEADERLVDRLNCTVFPFGLWAGPEIGQKPMGEWHTDACSFVNTGEGSRDQGFGTVMDANSVLSILDFSDKIDLVVCNVEGYEFELLPYLREKGWLRKIDRLAVQWHLGLGTEPKSLDDVDKEIYILANHDSFILDRDERPAWSYHVRDYLKTGAAL